MDRVQEDLALFEACVAEALEWGPGGVKGVFGPKSATWRLLREAFVTTGGLAALLLQLAHPAVAAGVMAHSDFQHDAIGRARRTFTSMYGLLFGDEHTAVAMARRIHGIHATVVGVVPDDCDSTWAGRPYRANDPELLLWVLATLVQYTMVGYETMIGPLTREDKEAYYVEVLVAAGMMGIPKHVVPADIDAFGRYWRDMIHGDVLATNPTSMALRDAVFSSPVTPPHIDSVVATGFLPPIWRDRYGLPWTTLRRREFKWGIRLVRKMLRNAPPAMRYVPAYHQAQLRLARAEGLQGSRLARLIDAVDNVVPLPGHLPSVERFGTVH